MPKLNSYSSMYNREFSRDRAENKRNIAVFDTEGEALGVISLCFDTIQRLFNSRQISLEIEGNGYTTIVMYCTHLVYTYGGAPNQNFPQFLMNCTGGNPALMAQIDFIELAHQLNSGLKNDIRHFRMYIYDVHKRRLSIQSNWNL